MLFGTASCSDDHFDVIPESATGAQNLWENILGNGETNDLAAIMRRTIVMKSETDRQGFRNGEMLTYDKLLSDPQAYTVWAPKDGTYDASYYTNLLDQRDIGLIDIDDKILGLVREKVLDNVECRYVGLGGDLDQHDDAADLGVEAQLARLQIDVAGKDIVEDDVLDKIGAVVLFIIVLLDRR